MLSNPTKVLGKHYFYMILAGIGLYLLVVGLLGDSIKWMVFGSTIIIYGTQNFLYWAKILREMTGGQ